MAVLQLHSISSSPLKSCHFYFNRVVSTFFARKPCLAQRRVAVFAISSEPAKPDSSQPQQIQSAPKKKPEKPVYSLKKRQIVRVDKEKYLNSINGSLKHMFVGDQWCTEEGAKFKAVTEWKRVYNIIFEEPFWIAMEEAIKYLSVGHPKYYKGLDYIYEDRGEVLDVRVFETGEYALIAWVGIPTAPAWLPTYMLIKSEKLNYQRV